MRLFNLFLLFIIIVLSNVLIAQKYGLGDVDKAIFEKYRVPEIIFQNLFIDGNMLWNYNSDQFARKDYNSLDKINSNVGLMLNPVYKYVRESEDIQISIGSQIRLSGSKSNNERQLIDSEAYEKNSHESFQYQLRLIPKIKKYLGDSDLFYCANGEFSLVYDFTEIERKNQHYENYDYSNMSKRNRQSYLIQLGLGIGRLRNITPLIEAIRLRNRLELLTSKTDKINDDVLLSLAKSISKRSAYNEVYDRADKYYWQEIQETLNKRDINLNGLNQYASSYLREVFDELKFMRYEGTSLSALMKINYNKSWYEQNSKDEVWREQFFVGGGFEFTSYNSLSLNSQFYIQALLSGSTNATNNPNIRQKYSLELNTKYFHELTDRFLIMFSNSFEYNILNSYEALKDIKNVFTVDFDYFLEDELTINTGYNWSHSFKKDIYVPSDYTRNNHGINIGFTYYFMREFLD